MPNCDLRQLLNRSITIARCIVAITVLRGSSPLIAQDAPAGGSVIVNNLTMGFEGHGRVGNWLPVQLQATGLVPSTEVSLVITASDPKGDQCESIVAIAKSDNSGGLAVGGVFMIGRQEGTIKLRLDDAARKALWQHSVVCHALDTKKQAEAAAESATVQSSGVISEMTLLRHHSLTALTIGSPAGIAELSERLQSSDSTQGSLAILNVPTMADVPDSRRGLDSVDTLVLVSDYSLSEQQTRAVKDWILTGGNLIVSCGENLSQLLASSIGGWLQPEFGIQPEPMRSQDLSSIRNFVSGSSQLQTNRQNVSILKMVSDQPRVIVNSINGPLISRISVGGGVVTLVAVDLNLKPLNRWLSLSQMYEMLLFGRQLDTNDEQVSRKGRISSTGVSDLSTQLANVSDAIPATQRWSSWHAMLLMIVYLVIIGPLDYLLVVRLLRRPRLTWVTFPTLVAAACGVTFLWSGTDRADATVREVQLLDFAQNGSRQAVRTRTWSSLSTSDSRFGSVSVMPLPVLAERTAPASVESLIWNGRAEDVYGGLYRPGGAGLGRQTSHRTDIAPFEFSSLPMVVDGSQAFLAESFFEVSESPAFESQLQMPASGLLDGSFEHHLPVPIRDWAILFGNRAYLPSEKSDEKFKQLEPNQRWSRDSGGVRISEVRDFLRGVRIVRKALSAKKSSLESETTQIQSTYDISGTNPLDILLMVSMYNVAGGENYVRLQDDYLRRDEVSDAIQLNTALLIGTVDLPLTQFQLDHQPITPVETQTVVRILLPVKRILGGDAPAARESKDDE